VPAHHFEALTEVIALGLAIGLDLGLLPGFLQKEKATICFIQIILIIKKLDAPRVAHREAPSLLRKFSKYHIVPAAINH
jgi:hypothetical protein